MAYDKLTVDDCKDLIAKTIDLYGSWGVGTAFDEDERFYELDFLEDLCLPLEVEGDGTVLSTARDLVENFVNHIDLSNARVSVNRNKTSTVSNEESRALRTFSLGILYMMMVEPDLSVWRTMGKHFSLYGLTAVQTLYKADAWPGRPLRKEDENDDDFKSRESEFKDKKLSVLPIVVRAVHPRNVYPDPAYGGRQYVVEYHQKMVFDVLQRWPRWNNPMGRKMGDATEYKTLWTPTIRYEEADGMPLLPGKGIDKHGYGFLPWTFIETGLGNVSADGDLSKRYVGILRYIKDMLISESRNFSMGDVILKYGAWPVSTLEGEGAEEVAANTKISQRYGSLTVLPPGVTMKKQAPDVPPDAIRTQLSIVSEYIAASMGPRSTRGLSETGVRSGVDRERILAEAGSRFRYASEAFRYGAARVLINCARLFKSKVPDDVRVWAHTPMGQIDEIIKKDKIREPFIINVEFAPISPEDEYRRHDDLERLVASGIVDEIYAQEKMPDVDPEQIAEHKERLKAMNDPMVEQVFSQYRAAEVIKLITKHQGVQAIQAGAVPGQGGAPPMGREPSRRMVPITPEIAPLGSAEAMQQKLAQQRSQIPMNPMQGQGGGGNRR